jgi:iron(III) transport system ATP-binding protein
VSGSARYEKLGAVLTVRQLVKAFPGQKASGGQPVVAVDDVSFEVAEGRLFTLLGPSGCGKTTTLRAVAGLERPDGGEIEVAGRVLFSASRSIDVPASRRGLGMVFQSYAIWPHMNVFENAAFPLRVAARRVRPTRAEIRERVERVLRTVRLDHLAGRQATDLSGGEQQRLALARALALEPPLLLLDEPLSNLDARLREEMRIELKRLQRQLRITTVYVTHDQIEALAMSSSIAVMRAGRIEQLGRPREIYERPASRFVADFLGAANLVEARVEARAGEGLYTVRSPAGALRAASAARHEPGAEVLVVIRPENVVLELPTPSTNGSRWRGTVQARAFLGDAVEHVVRVGDSELRARTEASVSIRPGTEVAVGFRERSCSLVERYP